MFPSVVYSYEYCTVEEASTSKDKHTLESHYSTYSCMHRVCRYIFKKINGSRAIPGRLLQNMYSYEYVVICVKWDELFVGARRIGRRHQSPVTH